MLLEMSQATLVAALTGTLTVLVLKGRLGTIPPGVPSRPAAPRRTSPRRVRVACVCLTLCLLGGLVDLLSGLLAGPAAALLASLPAGRRWARTAALVLTAAVVGVSTASLAGSHPAVPIAVGATRAVLYGTALRLLLHARR